jgi:hypothetical protein
MLDPMLQGKRALLAVVCACATAAPLGAAELKLDIRNGRVNLVAKDVPARQILAEWERIGRTKVDNADKLPPTLLTLQLEDVTERQALETILRSASGYIAKARTDMSAGPSSIDRILIMPPSTAVATTTAARPLTGSAPPPPTFRPPGFPMGDAPDDQDPPVPQPQNVPGIGMPVSPGMPGYVPPPMNGVPAGSIPQYPGSMLTLPNGQQIQYPGGVPQPTQPQTNPQNPFMTAPSGSMPGVINPIPAPGVPVPNVPGVKRPAGGSQ